MSAVLGRLRKRAAELEQKKQFDKALEVYIQILDEGGKDLGDEDVPLFNRVGDMLMRKGSVTEALGYYERAVDLYAERGFLNNAIALCSKILRQSPGRAAVYYKLGRISARKGFKSDARKNFLEYADRMQKAGQADEAFRALKEFASLYPDQDDVRLVLAELLSKENRKGEALEQLQALYEKLQAEGRQAEARATIDRMRAIDPSVTPREGSSAPMSSVADLVFLDLTDDEQRRPVASPAGDSQPVSARAPVAPSVAALAGLSLTFVPDEDEEASRPDGFETTAVSETPDLSPVVGDATPAEAVLEIEAVIEDPRNSAADLDAVVPLETLDDETPADIDIDIVEEEVPLLEDLVPTSSESEVIVEDLVAPLRDQPPLSGSEFADIDLEEAPRPEVQREHDLSLPGELPLTPDDVSVVSAASPASAAAAEDARAAADEAADLEADVAAREALQQRTTPAAVPALYRADDDSAESDDLPDDEEDGPFFGAADLDAPVATPVEEIASLAAPDDFMAMPPRFGETSGSQDHAFPPLFGLDEAGAAAPEPALVLPDDDAPLPRRIHTPRSTISIGGAEGHLRRRLELDPENWELRRQLGEALLDTGDREGGLYELELAMVGFELDGDTDRAQEVVDEILGVFPTSVRHHQKRVEYAVRSRDRVRLAHSYLELADALFRTGAGDKAVSVYSRVLELDNTNERAEFALATLAPDALARLRGAPVRPDRWSDELLAIAEPITLGASVAPDDAPSDDAPEVVAEAEPPLHDVEPIEPEVVAFELALPDEPAGEEAAAELDQNEPAVEVEELALDEPVVEPVDERLDEEVDEPLDEPLDEPVDEPVDDPAVASNEVRGDWPSPDHEEVKPEPAAEATPEQEELDEEETATPTFEEAVAAEPELLAVRGNEAPAAEPNGTADHIEEQTVIAEREPPPAPRSPTPRSVPAEPSRLDRVRSLTPVGTSDSEFVDLGDWLRATEPTRSTRMQVEDPKPTGDEQADFEELLRRFKRGVAENVEAEDYEAHYDLGVAYKEMGLTDEAIAQFQKALRGSSKRVRAYEALGQCFVEKKQYPIAAALLQRATELPGSDDQVLVGVLYLLGFAMEHMARPADALPYYLRVFAVDIEFRDIAQRVAAMGNASK